MILSFKVTPILYPRKAVSNINVNLQSYQPVHAEGFSVKLEPSKRSVAYQCMGHPMNTCFMSAFTSHIAGSSPYVKQWTVFICST
jgi:hypothetical protein